MPGLSGSSASIHTLIWSAGWSRNCCWRLIVQLMSQFESSTLTMPPVTVWPPNGERPVILSMYGMISSSSVVAVALIHFVRFGS